MVATIQQIEEISSDNVVFYTVTIDDKEIPEFQDFQQRMKISYPTELSEVNKFIQKIKENNDGAEPRFFKKQKTADRLKLPTPDIFDKTKPDPKSYGLRNYSVWLSKKTVFLLNGDLKTYSLAQDCPNCCAHFEMANKIAAAIDTAIYMNEIEIDEEGYILIEDNYKLSIA